MSNDPISIGGKAVSALIAEADATPKPGLVDRANNGAHRDMNHALFLKSADALYGYFCDIAAKGYETARLPPSEAFLLMRQEGKEAENRMFAVTGGVNTHKGAIFSLGLVAAAAGRLSGSGYTPEMLLDTAAAFVAEICQRELFGLKTPATKGECAYRQYGLLGARGEAQNGFPAVRGYGLPSFRYALTIQDSEEVALLFSLINLMANMFDTNIVTRVHYSQGEYVRQRALQVLASPNPIGSLNWFRELTDMDEEFIARNISPGGCADMLALTHFVHALTVNQSIE